MSRGRDSLGPKCPVTDCIVYTLTEILHSDLSRSGPGCSKLTTSLVNVSLKFQTLISQISRYFC